MSNLRSAGRTLLFAAAIAPSLPLLLAGTRALAQSDTSSLSGTVTDPSGAVVPNAKVTAKNDATGAESKATSNSEGAYTITNISSGTYTVTVEAPGFQTAVQQGTHIDPSIGARTDVSLKSGSASTTVTVQADANRLQTESASVGQLVTAEQVKSIQLNGRNPMYLSQLEPGVTRNAPMSSFNFSLDNSLYVNGARSQESLLAFDGSPMVRTRSNNNSVGVADVDSTSQVQILTTGYQSEYGRTSGGQVRMIPKSGTSTFHGAAYEYLRNSFFNANTWQRNNNTADPTISGHPEAFRYNQFGWSLSGPVYIPGHFNTSKQKLFFLAGQEYVRYRRSPTQTGKVPTLAMRNGDFSELLGPNIFYSKPVQITNPKTGQAYANNMIPASDLSTNGAALLRAYPAPNVTNNSAYNWQEALANPQDQRKDTLVLDYVPAERHRLRFSVLSYHLDYITPFAGNFDRTPEKWHWPNQVGALHYTWEVTPTMVNEASATVTADHITISYDTANGLYNRENYGINFPYIYSATDKLIPNKIPTINLANFTTLDGGPYPSHSGGVITDVADNLTKVIGNHTLKFGGLWERSGENNFDQISVSSTTPGSTNNQNGQFRFTDTRQSFASSGVAAANAALGLFDTYGEIGTKSYTLFRGNMYEGFAQDTWRAKPNLVVEYGARYSVMRPYYTLWGNQSFFDPAKWNPANAPTVDPTTGFISGGNQYNGVVIPGSRFPSAAKGHVPDSILTNPLYNSLFTGTNPGYSKTIFSDIQPRVGITYQVRPNTVIRVGGGRYTQRLGISDQVQLGGNAPFQPTTFVSGGNVDNPAGTTSGTLPLSLTSQPYNFPNPNAWSWNAAVEQDIPGFATFSIAYVGRRGLHLQQLEQLNQLRPGTLPPNSSVNADSLRPYRGFSSILQIDNAGSSIYHSMQLNLKRRLSHGLLFGAAYTWSKSLDYGSDQSYQLPNYYDHSSNYGPSDFDIRNTLVVNYVWDIPYGSNFSNRVVRGTLGNWQLSGTTQAQSGEPFTVSTGDDFAGVGPGAGPQRWDITSIPNTPHRFGGNGQTGYWFQTTPFVQPSAGTLAPRGTRNTIYNPGFQSWNVALQKNFHVIPNHDNHVLTFRGEAFNFTNHPNWDNADSNPTSGTFGQITTKGGTYASDRQLQFSLRYAF